MVDLVLRALEEGLGLVVLAAVPLLLVVFIVGLVVGLVQSATQIHDPGWSLVPKLLAVGAVLFFLAPTLGGELLRLTREVWGLLSSVR